MGAEGKTISNIQRPIINDQGERERQGRPAFAEAMAGKMQNAERRARNAARRAPTKEQGDFGVRIERRKANSHGETRSTPLRSAQGDPFDSAALRSGQASSHSAQLNLQPGSERRRSLKYPQALARQPPQWYL